MSHITEYVIEHHNQEPEKGWLLTNAEWEKAKEKLQGKLPNIVRMAIANPRLVSNATKASLERDYPEVHFPWMEWDGEDFN